MSRSQSYNLHIFITSSLITNHELYQVKRDSNSISYFPTGHLRTGNSNPCLRIRQVEKSNDINSVKPTADSPDRNIIEVGSTLALQQGDSTFFLCFHAIDLC